MVKIPHHREPIKTTPTPTHSTGNLQGREVTRLANKQSPVPATLVRQCMPTKTRADKSLGNREGESLSPTQRANRFAQQLTRRPNR